jgi:polysaccharide biosynthesis transport protein
MTTDEQEIQRVDIRDYLRIILRSKYIIVLTTVLIAGVALFWSHLQPNVYETEAQMIIVPRDPSRIFEGISAGASGDSARNVTNELIRLRTLQPQVEEALGRDVDVTFANVKESDVIMAKARGRRPRQVAQDANQYVDTYFEQRSEDNRNELEADLNELIRQNANLTAQRDGLIATGSSQSTIGVLQTQITNNQLQIDTITPALAQPTISPDATKIQEAAVPTSPVEPKPLKNALVALGIGLVLGIGLAFLRDYVDDTVKERDDVEWASGLTVVGMIPQLTDWKDRAAPRLAARESPSGPSAEAYRTLRTSIQFLGLERTLRTLLVTSPAAGEGKTTTAGNLAIAFAHAGQRVVLVSSDLRRPRLHQFFGLSNQTGFTSVLLGETPFSEALKTLPDEPYVTVLPSGPRPPNPSELLNSRRAAEAIAALAGRFDLVLIDSPPVLPVSDSLVIAGLADAILVVAKAGLTRKKALHRSIELLRQVEAPLVGAVLNGADSGTEYGYGSEYAPDDIPRLQKVAKPKRAVQEGGSNSSDADEAA